MKQQFLTLARYNEWMNRKLYAACETLSDEQRKRDLCAFFKSIHGTLNHILLADSVWLSRFAGDSPSLRREDGSVLAIRSLDQILYDDFQELAEQRSAMDQRLRSWVHEISDDALQHDIMYRTSTGTECAHPLWQGLLHCFNHQAHHRGQATTLLTQLGVDVGATDLIAMLRETES